MNQAIKSKILANPYTFPENGINVNLKLILRDLCVDIVYLRKMSESEWAFKNDAKKMNSVVVTIPCKFYWNDHCLELKDPDSSGLLKNHLK